MYAVVGCNECRALWIVEDRPDTTQCPRCRTRHQFDRLKTFARTEDENEARDARAALLAKRSGGEDALDALDSFESMEAAAAEAGVSDREYLESAGIDVAEAREAGDTDGSESRSRREIVLDALAGEEPVEGSTVVEYATSHGVPEEDAREALRKLVRSGQASETGGEYRLL